jgi:hypothetical protein
MDEATEKRMSKAAVARQPALMEGREHASLSLNQKKPRK